MRFRSTRSACSTPVPFETDKQLADGDAVSEGAERGGIARLVLVSGGKLALLGCLIGILGAVTVSKVISSFLFGVSVTDPLVYPAGVLIRMLMVLAAGSPRRLRGSHRSLALGVNSYWNKKPVRHVL